MMIWEAIKTGLEILGHWQFWVASIFFSSIFIIMFLLLGLGLSKTMENQKTAVLGCVGGAILPSLLQVVFISMLVVFLLPLFMGGDELTPLTYLSDEWWRIVKAGFFGFVILMLIAFIPVIGEIATKTPGVSIFIIGMVIFHRIAGRSLRYLQEINGTNIDLKPDFWSIIGFIILAWIIVSLFTMAIVTILTSLNIISADMMEAGALFLGPAIGVIPGLITLSVYISYVMLKLKIAI
jgi:hypothetical protein